MFELFYININLFKIYGFEINKPINIRTIDDKYLSCGEYNNIIDFYIMDDDSNRQKWIIEHDEFDLDIYYIKSVFNRHNFVQYLGCPNKNNQVFLYTSKNKYTKWKIINIEENIFYITYVGEKFNENDISLIVARYNEDIDWVKAYDDIAIIYNKGDKINIYFNRIINIENIGREGHTYLYHIINNYNNLSSRVIFTQADPFTHNNTLLFGIDNYDKFIDVQPLGLYYIKEMIPPSIILSNNKIITKYGLEYLVIKVNNNLDYCDKYYFDDSGIKNLIMSYYNRFKNTKSIIENFLIRSNFPYTKQINKIRYTWCGLFSVIKEKIIKYDISIYNNLLNELISYDSQGGENGYILERLWLYIFED